MITLSFPLITRSTQQTTRLTRDQRAEVAAVEAHTAWLQEADNRFNTDIDDTVAFVAADGTAYLGVVTRYVRSAAGVWMGRVEVDYFDADDEERRAYPFMSEIVVIEKAATALETVTAL